MEAHQCLVSLSILSSSLRWEFVILSLVTLLFSTLGYILCVVKSAPETFANGPDSIFIKNARWISSKSLSSIMCLMNIRWSRSAREWSPVVRWKPVDFHASRKLLFIIYTWIADCARCHRSAGNWLIYRKLRSKNGVVVWSGQVCPICPIDLA